MNLRGSKSRLKEMAAELSADKGSLPQRHCRLSSSVRRGSETVHALQSF